MITLSALNLYPVKGGAGIPLEAGELDAFGLRDDRRWMVVDDDSVAVTQRESPRLCLLRALPTAEALILDAPGLPTLERPRPQHDAQRSLVTIWGDACEAVDLGSEAAAWCSRFLERPCRLVYMPDSTHRPTDRDYDPVGSRVSFTDGFPMLLLGQASLDDLNARLDSPLPMNRFRPNLGVAGSAAYAEDEWRRIRIGGILLELVKPCARCPVSTTDQETAERGQEPLRTLATYRKRGSTVLFGMNVVHRGLGTLRVGDLVEVLSDGHPKWGEPTKDSCC